MRFLLYDKSQKDLTELRDLLHMMSTDFEVDTIVDYNNFLELFNTYTYDVIFIDISDATANKIVSFIQDNTSQQKLVLLSDSFKNLNHKVTCAECKEAYNTVRVAKPFRHSDFFFLVEDVKCPFDFGESNLASKLMCLLKKYNEFNFDKETMQITYETRFDISINFINICEDLKENNIDYEVTANNYIQINGEKNS